MELRWLMVFKTNKQKEGARVCEAQGLTSGFAWSCWLCGQALRGRGQQVLTMHPQQLRSAGQLGCCACSLILQQPGWV